MNSRTDAGSPAGAAADPLQSALERKPAVLVPADFAHRVALRAAGLPMTRERSGAVYARVIAMVVAVLVAAVLFALAPSTAASFNNVLFDLQLVILLQLGMVAWWLATRSTQGR